MFTSFWYDVFLVLQSLTSYDGSVPVFFSVRLNMLPSGQSLFLTRIFCRRISCLTTDCPWRVCCRGLITWLLCESGLFGAPSFKQPLVCKFDIVERLLLCFYFCLRYIYCIHLEYRIYMSYVYLEDLLQQTATASHRNGVKMHIWIDAFLNGIQHVRVKLTCFTCKITCQSKMDLIMRHVGKRW